MTFCLWSVQLWNVVRQLHYFSIGVLLLCLSQTQAEKAVFWRGRWVDLVPAAFSIYGKLCVAISCPSFDEGDIYLYKNDWQHKIGRNYKSVWRTAGNLCPFCFPIGSSTSPNDIYSLVFWTLDMNCVSAEVTVNDTHNIPVLLLLLHLLASYLTLLQGRTSTSLV